MVQVNHPYPAKRSVSVRLLASGGICALALTIGSPCLAQPGSGGRRPESGAGMGWDGSGRMGPNDQRFIVMMIPHHEGAITMADLALTRAHRPEIRALARRIRESQTKENALMRSWYRQWFGAEVPAWGGSYGRGVYSGWGGWMGRGHGMGMMGTDVQWLKNAPDFDRAFIEQMIPHHRMGVMMASMAQANSQHPQLRDLQQAMVRVQSDEIEQMAAWYRTWYGTP